MSIIDVALKVTREFPGNKHWCVYSHIYTLHVHGTTHCLQAFTSKIHMNISLRVRNPNQINIVSVSVF